MKVLKLAMVAVLALVFSACSDVFFQDPYKVVLDPAQLGYEVDDQGRVTVVANDAYVQVSPGAPGGRLERYEYMVVDDSGNEVFAGSSLGSGFIGVEVPAGREESGGSVVYVAKRSQPFTFSLDGTVAREHLTQGAPLNWRYLVTWYVRTHNGNIVRWTDEYQIKYPLRR